MVDKDFEDFISTELSEGNSFYFMSENVRSDPVIKQIKKMYLTNE